MIFKCQQYISYLNKQIFSKVTCKYIFICIIKYIEKTTILNVSSTYKFRIMGY